jgi:hypothetical protein
MNKLKETVKDRFNGLAADFYNAGIPKLITRYHKCLNLHGDYVEKDLKSVVMMQNNFLYFFNNQAFFTFWTTLVL